MIVEFTLVLRDKGVRSDWYLRRAFTRSTCPVKDQTINILGKRFKVTDVEHFLPENKIPEVYCDVPMETLVKFYLDNPLSCEIDNKDDHVQQKFLQSLGEKTGMTSLS